MNILSIDTSSQVCSISVISNETHSSVHIEARNSQSTIIIEEIKKLLEKRKLRLKDINYIVYGAGPGSFTGVRLSLSIATGLVIANDITTIGISSTLSIAYEAFMKYGYSNVSVIQDARKNEVFFAEYTLSSDKISVVTKDQLILPNELILSKTSQAIAGSAINIISSIHEKYKVLDITTPNSYYQGTLAKRLIEQDNLDKFNMSCPNYVRNNVTG